MKLSRRGAKFIGSFEGFRSCAYRDPVGVWTIGFGTTNPRHAKPGKCISRRKALRLLRRDAKTAGEAVERTGIHFKQHQFDALVSFIYNVGVGAFEESTLRRLLRKRQFHAAAEQFLRWDKAGGQTLPGLTRRRMAERRVFLHGFPS